MKDGIHIEKLELKQRLSLVLCPLASQLSCNGPAIARLICDTAGMLKNTIKWTIFSRSEENLVGMENS